MTPAPPRPRPTRRPAATARAGLRGPTARPSDPLPEMQWPPKRRRRTNATAPAADAYTTWSYFRPNPVPVTVDKNLRYSVIRALSQLPARTSFARLPLERRHHILGEPAQLLDELLGPEPLGPVDHEVLQPGILRGDRLDAVDHLGGRAAEPGLLRDAVGEPRRARRRPGRAPGAPFLVRVAHEAERREPLEALVVRRLEPAQRLGMAVGEVDAGAPDHVLAELFRPAMLVAGRMIGAHDVVEDLLAVERHHRLEAVLRHQLDGLAAGDRHPDVDRQVQRPGHHGDVLDGIAAIRD